MSKATMLALAIVAVTFAVTVSGDDGADAAKEIRRRIQSKRGFWATAGHALDLFGKRGANTQNELRRDNDRRSWAKLGSVIDNWHGKRDASDAYELRRDNGRRSWASLGKVIDNWHGKRDASDAYEVRADDGFPNALTDEDAAEIAKILESEA